jgi:hypothetical protein
MQGEATLERLVGDEGNGADRKRITQDDVHRGLDVMRRDYPKHFVPGHGRERGC